MSEIISSWNSVFDVRSSGHKEVITAASAEIVF